MDSQESELGGRNPTPLTFLSCVCSGGWLLSSGVQPPRQFLPWLIWFRAISNCSRQPVLPDSVIWWPEMDITSSRYRITTSSYKRDSNQCNLVRLHHLIMLLEFLCGIKGASFRHVVYYLQNCTKNWIRKVKGQSQTRTGGDKFWTARSEEEKYLGGWLHPSLKDAGLVRAANKVCKRRCVRLHGLT